ncbi:hypothetical protein, partial [Polycladomyces subterraneus]
LKNPTASAVWSVNFMVKDRTLSCILSGIAGKQVNITGYLQTRLRHQLNLVRLVVGPPDLERRSDLQVVRNVLRSLCVPFQEKKVLQILRISTRNTRCHQRIFGALWCRVKVKAIYIGEETRLFVDVSKLGRAVRILSQQIGKQCPKRCG